MPEGFLYRHDIRPCFIEVKSKGMPACVQNEAPARKPRGFNSSVEYIPYSLLTHGSARLLAGEKKIVFRSMWIAVLNIFGQDPECFPGKDGITLRTVLGSSDEDVAPGLMDVSATEPA